ncbi:hypothetical protein [Marimonas lutisalis]|uniref:hypothetical protein n=1 Tax=Marimonas lutisalis TaxID=2545756 RepID=UPI0010F6D682|nr:hypothetical protein [Marimonas lutisalis]
MFSRLSKLLLLSLLAAASLSQHLAAQSADKVRTDVLSALSTPLPITIIGPLLTRDVVVTEEDGGFRATLQETTLMGLFPFGEVSFRLEPAGDDNYRISELSFSTELDFPGIGRVTFSGMELDGTWSASRRSYSELKWVTNDLRFAPGQGDQGTLSLGRLSFDVMKEPDETDTESRFEISASDVALLGMTPENVSLGEIRALLAANGERPVDLYSVIRELIMLSTVRDGGAQLKTLGSSLLGNSYETIVLDVSASDVSVVNPRRPEEDFFRAGVLEAKAELSDVAPRDWGGAQVSLRFGNVDQRGAIPESAVKVESATFRLSGGELPVADMVAAFMTFAEPPRDRPVAVSSLLDGLAEFGKLEFASEGKAFWMEVFDERMRDGEREITTEFETGYDSWTLSLALADLNRNEGKVTFGTEFLGGRFVPGEDTPDEVSGHIRAWFPVGLRLTSTVSNLNEAFLKQMFADVYLRDMREPVELILPMVLYGAATVLQVDAGEDFYQTELFRLSQSGSYKVYPTEVFSLLPYEGEATVQLSGLEGLLAYFDATMAELRPRSDEAAALSAVKSGLIVLRNLAEEGEAGSYRWQISRPDVTRSEIVLNGTTLRYPNVMEYLPILPLVFGLGRF